MPSSTSSSDKNRSSGSWLKTLVFGLVAVLGILSAWELYWRSTGFDPVIEDDLGIWAINRLAVQDRKETTIVLLGASRMQLDVDPQVIQTETGYKALMLAIDGSSPLPVLADLARASSFNGIILCSLLPQWLADSGSGKSRSAKWVSKFHKLKWSSWIETHLSLTLQSNFVFRYPGLLPEKMWNKFREGEKPRPPYAPMRSDRYRSADYTKTDITKLRTSRIKRQREIVAQAKPLTEKAFDARIAEIETMVQEIRDRGGEVFFLRLPACDEILEFEEKTWPRRKYWDRFAAIISARTFHFADYPELSGFDCPDGSHLDYRDARSFTLSLLDVLELRQYNEFDNI